MVFGGRWGGFISGFFPSLSSAGLWGGGGGKTLQRGLLMGLQLQQGFELFDAVAVVRCHALLDALGVGWCIRGFGRGGLNRGGHEGSGCAQTQGGNAHGGQGFHGAKLLKGEVGRGGIVAQGLNRVPCAWRRSVGAVCKSPCNWVLALCKD